MSILIWICYFCYSVEAELEYLKIAQDLEMYGISYFHIRVSNVCLFIQLPIRVRLGIVGS